MLLEKFDCICHLNEIKQSPSPGGWEQNLNIYMNILNDFKLIYIKVTYAVNNNYNENEKMKDEER